MCKTISFCTINTKIFWFYNKARKALLKDNPNSYQPDSHTSICDILILMMIRSINMNALPIP